MITFTETTGILDRDDIRRKTRIWQFDSSTGRVTKTWWINDAEFKCENEEYDNTIPLTIQSFTNRYLDASVGRCATLNGTENYVLIKNGDWDKPLHDGDLVGMVPAVGFIMFGIDLAWYVWAYIAAMTAMLAYAIYMIATMKTGDGSGSTTVYSLSSMTNQKRPGEIVERQYGYLKRYPAYAANPYTIYKNNVQRLYAIFCVGHGKFEFDANDPMGFENTNEAAYSDLSITTLPPNAYAWVFANNIVTSSEVADGLELIPYNEGKNAGKDGAWEDAGYEGPNGYTKFSTPYGDEDGWSGWFTANSYGTVTTKLINDYCFPNGLGHTKKNGDSQSYTVSWQMQYRSMTKAEDGSITYGTPVTKSYSKTKATNTALRYTYETTVPSGAYQVRSRRTSKRDALSSANGQRTRETLQWTALRAALPHKLSFGNRTIIMLKAKAQNGLTDSAAKRFYIKGTAYSPVYDATTKTWTNTANRNPVWAICDMMRSSNGGNYPDSMLDLDNLVAWAKWCDDNEVYFDYCFDGQSDIFSQLNVAARVMRASVVFPNGLLSILRDEPITIPAAMFTKENIVDGSFKIQYKGVTSDDYDGLQVEYADPDDEWNTNTVDCILAGSDGANLKTTTMKGCTDRTRAYRLGMYEWSTEMENRAAISFDTTITGWQAEPGTMIYVNYPLFRQHISGQIVSINGTTVVLSCNVKLNSEYNNIFKIRNCKTGGVLGTYLATYTDSSEGDYHTLTLDSAPDTSGMVFSDPQALPTFALGIATNFAKKCRVTKTQNKAEGTSIECFIDTDARFAYDAAYPDTITPGGDTGGTSVTSNITLFSSGIDGPHEFAWDSEDLMYVSAMDGDAVYKVASDGVATEFATGIWSAYTLIFDSYDNLFVSCPQVSSIKKIKPDGTKADFATGVGQIYGMIIDVDDNLYCASNTNNCIYKITPDGTKSILTAGIEAATGLLWNSDKTRMYCASFSGNIYSIEVSTGVATVFASGLGQCYELVLDTDGNLFVTRYFQTSDTLTGLWKITAAGAVSSFSNIKGAHDLTISSDGTLYVSSFDTDQIYSITSTGKLTVIASGMDGPYGLSFSPSGYLFTAAYNGDAIYYIGIGVTISAPSDVTAAPYVEGSDGVPSDITISWDAVSGFDTYIVQYSQDGESWTTVTSSASATSVMLGSYITGMFYARVAVVYNGCIWSWGESTGTYMPVSTLGYVYVTADNFIDTTTDSYKYVSQG